MIWHLIKSNIENFENIFQGSNVLNKSVPVLMGIFIFLNPFPHITSIKEVIFYPTVFLVITLLLFKKIEFSIKTPLSLPFGLFIFWAFLNLFFALDTLNSIHDFFAHLIKYIAFYYILINYFGSINRLNKLSWVIMVSTTLFSVVSLFFFYVVLNNPLTTRFGSTFTDSAMNIMGFGTVLGLLLAFHLFFSEKIKYRKILSLLCAIPLFAASVLTQSRSTLIALILSLFILLANRKKTLVGFSVIILVFILINPVKVRFTNYDDYHVRLGLTYYSFELIKDYPLMGSGFSIDTFGDPKFFEPEEYMARIPEKYRIQPHGFFRPHNMFLSMGIRVGLFGLALFLYILFVPIKMCWRLIRFGKDESIRSWGFCVLSVFIMFCLKGLFEPIFIHFAETIFYTILSMITILWRINEEDIYPV